MTADPIDLALMSGARAVATEALDLLERMGVDACRDFLTAVLVWDRESGETSSAAVERVLAGKRAGSGHG